MLDFVHVAHGFSGCHVGSVVITRIMGSRVHWLQVAQCLWCARLVAPQYVGPSSPNQRYNLSPALQGRFFTTGPPGKSLILLMFL